MIHFKPKYTQQANQQAKKPGKNVNEHSNQKFQPGMLDGAFKWRNLYHGYYGNIHVIYYPSALISFINRYCNYGIK